jgi:transposase InsO family protein
LIHVDVKKLGRIERGAGDRMTGRRRDTGRRTDAAGVRRLQVGWDYVHVAIDDHSRLAYAEVLPDEKATTVIGLLKRAIAFYGQHNLTVEQLLTDNGPGYRSTIHAIACRALGVRHLRTRPHRPQTNGKAQRFIRTLLPAGPTAPSTATAQNEPPPLTAGSGATTITANSQPSATTHPSPG